MGKKEKRRRAEEREAGRYEAGRHEAGRYEAARYEDALHEAGSRPMQPADAPHYASAWWPPTPLSEPRSGFAHELGGVATEHEHAEHGHAGHEHAGHGHGSLPPGVAATRADGAATERLRVVEDVRLLEPNQRRLLTLTLTFGVIALFFLVVGDVGQAVLQFGDLLLTFFLAWLVAFILGAPINGILRVIPRLPRGVAVALVYVVVLGAIGALIATLAAALAQSISDLVDQLPQIRERLPDIVAPIQREITYWGLQVDLTSEIDKLIDRLGASAATLVGPLQSIAVASLGAIGTTLLVVILSVYIALDSDAIRAFALRLIPPGHHDEWRRFEISVSQAFGGFLRGQVGLGLVYGALAAGVSLALGLEFVPVTTAATAVLHMVPFFGPFVSWAPPVLVAIFTAPAEIVPALVAMVVGWFVVMNVLQPRVMNAAIGLHPIVVLASVLVGSKVAGVAGAVFGIPVAAVISAMFFYYFRIFGEREAEAAEAEARVELATEDRPTAPEPDEADLAGA